jgi:hypothetical protein
MLELLQHSDAIDTYRQNVRGELYQRENLGTTGWEPLFIEAKCLDVTCQHKWVIRTVKHISGLDGFDNRYKAGPSLNQSLQDWTKNGKRKG